MRTMQIAAAAMLSFALTFGNVSAQQGKSLRDQLVGTWTFVVAEITAADGKKSFPFGETPKGLLVFTPDGHFSQIHIASDVPKIASNNRLNGTCGAACRCSAPTRSTRPRKR
jgi:hypothetical protein